jgi:hypothetical protein
MKQTAVEWLEDNLLFEPWAEEHFKHNTDCWDKAKEMEKQQIMDAYNDAEDKCEYFIEEHAWQRYHHLSENYYKQTFKSE